MRVCKIFLLIAVAALCPIIVYGCSGGFGGDSAEADGLGPAIFGTDSTYR
jgi:hypothetical protein